MPCRWDAVWRAAQETSAAVHSQAPPQKESSWQFLSVPSGGWICWASLLALASSHGGGLKFFIPGKGRPPPRSRRSFPHCLSLLLPTSILSCRNILVGADSSWHPGS